MSSPNIVSLTILIGVLITGAVAVTFFHWLSSRKKAVEDPPTPTNEENTVTNPPGSGNRTQDAKYWLECAAKAGHAEAMYRRALLSPDDAEKWLRDAADIGHSRAAFQLGVRLQTRGLIAETIRWWTQAARAGHIEAAYHLGLLLNGLGNVDGARRSWEQAARAGHINSMYQLGMCLIGDEKPCDGAAWLGRAARTGHAEANYELGKLHRDHPKACGDCTAGDHAPGPSKEAAEPNKPDCGPPQHKPGHHGCYPDQTKAPCTDAAIKLLEKAANAGNVDAMYELGLLYHDANDGPTAKQWWEKAAGAGHVGAMIALGTYLRTRNEFNEAKPHLEAAAKAGYPEGMYQLALLMLDQQNRGQAPN